MSPGTEEALAGKTVRGSFSLRRDVSVFQKGGKKSSLTNKPKNIHSSQS